MVNEHVFMNFVFNIKNSTRASFETWKNKMCFGN